MRLANLVGATGRELTAEVVRKRVLPEGRAPASSGSRTSWVASSVDPLIVPEEFRPMATSHADRLAEQRRRVEHVRSYL